MFCWHCVDGGVLSTSFDEDLKKNCYVHVPWSWISQSSFSKASSGGMGSPPPPPYPAFYDWHIVVQYTHDDYSEHTKIAQSTPLTWGWTSWLATLDKWPTGLLQGRTATRSLLGLIMFGKHVSLFAVFALSEQIKAGREWCLAQLWCLFCLTTLCALCDVSAAVSEEETLLNQVTHKKTAQSKAE